MAASTILWVFETNVTDYYHAVKWNSILQKWFLEVAFIEGKKQKTIHIERILRLSVKRLYSLSFNRFYPPMMTVDSPLEIRLGGPMGSTMVSP